MKAPPGLKDDGDRGWDLKERLKVEGFSISLLRRLQPHDERRASDPLLEVATRARRVELEALRDGVETPDLMEMALAIAASAGLNGSADDLAPYVRDAALDDEPDPPAA